MPSRRAPKPKFVAEFQFLEPLIDNIICVFCDCVDRDSFSAADAAAIQTAIRQFQCTSRSCNEFVKASPRLPYYNAFVDSLGRLNSQQLFMDGIKQIQVFSGNFGRGPKNASKFDNITINGLISDRFKTAQRLASFDRVLLESRTGHYRPNDLPVDVGDRVAIFVGRVRALSQLYATRHQESVCPCELCGHATIMGPPCYLQEPRRSSNAVVVDSDEEEPELDVADSSGSFWRAVSPQLTSFLEQTKAPSVCCTACRLKFYKEFETLVPVNSAFLEEFELRNVPSSKTGLARVMATSAALQKRNAAVVRALREARRSCRINRPSLRMEIVERIHELMMDMLNIDLALVLAASTLAESPAMSMCRSLPACSAVWRENPSRWAHTMEQVRAIYFEHGGHRTRERTLTFLEQPKWLRHVVESAPELFPQTLSAR